MQGNARYLLSLFWLMQLISANKEPEPRRHLVPRHSTISFQPTPSFLPPIVAEPLPATENVINTIQMREGCQSYPQTEATAPLVAERTEGWGNIPCVGPLLPRDQRRVPHQPQLGEFEEEITGVVHSVLKQEMDNLVREIADKALRRINDRMLSFTMCGERYLCLNVVCTWCLWFLYKAVLALYADEECNRQIDTG